MALKQRQSSHSGDMVDDVRAGEEFSLFPGLSRYRTAITFTSAARARASSIRLG
jgi:hypothetical protein